MAQGKQEAVQQQKLEQNCSESLDRASLPIEVGGITLTAEGSVSIKPLILQDLFASMSTIASKTQAPWCCQVQLLAAVVSGFQNQNPDARYELAA